MKLTQTTKEKKMLTSVLLGLCLMVFDTQKIFADIPSSNIGQTQISQYDQLTNYGETRLEKLAQKLQNKDNQYIHIVQLGDSHTAGDYFTGQLRNRFQTAYGNGGPGFVPPTAIPGQRNADIGFHAGNGQWQLLSSRKDHSNHFPLGGFIAEPQTDYADLGLRLYNKSPEYFKVQALYSAQDNTSYTINNQTVPLKNTLGNWQLSPTHTIDFPASAVFTNNAKLMLGGWFVRSTNYGAMVSALGINGATLTMLNKWAPQWHNTLNELHPDMIILAYGTNEAFNRTLDLAEYKADLDEKIAMFRATQPDAPILLIGPSDSIENKRGNSCSTMQASKLHQVIQIQKEIAQKYHTLFWDWQAFMGGDCTILQWAQRGEARPDWVHLSQAGYIKSANGLYNQLIYMIYNKH